MDRRRPSHHARRSRAALKIQAAFLGFQIRKSFNQILDCGRRVESIQRCICQEESFDLIIKDDKERIKVTEALMKLILQLDSLQVHPAVRCCRKAVIKRAIAVQEAVDAIGEFPGLEVGQQEFQIFANHGDEEEDDDDDCGMVEGDDHESVAAGEVHASIKQQGSSSNNSGASLENLNSENSGVRQPEMKLGLSERGMMGKMMEDNEKLMSMVKNVFELNQAQAQSIRSLTERVEQLERDSLEEKFRKMRKRRHDIGVHQMLS